MLQNFTLLDPPSFAHCLQLKLPTLHKDVHKLNRHYNEHVYSEHDTRKPRSSGLDYMRGDENPPPIQMTLNPAIVCFTLIVLQGFAVIIYFYSYRFTRF